MPTHIRASRARQSLRSRPQESSSGGSPRRRPIAPSVVLSAAACVTSGAQSAAQLTLSLSRSRTRAPQLFGWRPCGGGRRVLGVEIAVAIKVVEAEGGLDLGILLRLGRQR
eukprot:137952-Prymnesium_polylepis.1